MEVENLRMRQLIEAGRTLMAELDPEEVLKVLLEEARRLTDARYAALGVLNEDRTGLRRFITSGIDEEERRAIGAPPSGRGVLGLLIQRPDALRLRDVGAHPESYGFPPRHPPMRTFLGVPIVVRGASWGNLYLAEKGGDREFTADDEDAVVVLAQWAGVAIENSRLFEAVQQRSRDAEHGLRSLQAARDIADAVGGTEDLERIFELIVKRGRALVEAQTVLIMLVKGDDLVVAAAAGRAREAAGHRIPLRSSTSGQVLGHGEPLRVEDVRAQLRVQPEMLGVEDAHTALIVPMMHQGTGLGVLMAFNRGEAGSSFSAQDEELLRAFAASAANAVAIRRSVESDRLRAAIVAADEERRRWARELHDQTLQALGGLRVLLASARKKLSGDGTREIDQAIEDVEVEIDNLRQIITDLRPAVLDDLGLLAAIEALVERRRDTGLEIEDELATPAELENAHLTPELETSVYRFVQEALTNVSRHAGAESVVVSIRCEGGELVAEIADDGLGFDTASPSAGFGLEGMRERIYLSGGRLSIESRPGAGTKVSARIPVDHPAGRIPYLAADNGG